MRLHYTKIVILVIVASLAVSAAYAADYVVKPNAMNGWVLATVTSAAPTPGYPGISTGFIDPAPRGLVTVAPILPGAFYCTLGGDGSTSYEKAPGQVWLGTNAYNGVALSRISDIEYHAWTTSVGIWVNKDKYWAPPRQPIGLRLVVKEANPSTVTHMFIWRPWNVGSPTGFGANAYYPDDTAYCEVWKTHNPTMAGIWLEFTYNGSPCNWTGTWAQVQTKYPGATITTPALQIPDSDGGQWPEAQPVNTPNACGLSLQWGAEMKGLCDWPQSPYINWWREAYMGIAYVDCFEISVDGSYDTYDFEADAPGHKTATSTNGTQDTTGGKAPFYGHLNMEYKVFGKVISKIVPDRWNVSVNKATPNNQEFFLDDGGITVRVFCDGNSVAVGQRYAVTGKLMPTYGRWLPTEPRHMRLHCTTDELESLD